MNMREFVKVRLGAYSNNASLLKKLKKKGVRITNCSIEVVLRLRLSSHREVPLVVLSPEDLGLGCGENSYPLPLYKIYDAAKSIGLFLCPEDLAPYLCLQILPCLHGLMNPSRKKLVIASEAIYTGCLSIFQISHEDYWLYLESTSGYLSSLYRADTRFVFAKKY